MIFKASQGVTAPGVPEMRRAVELLYFLPYKCWGALTGWMFGMRKRMDRTRAYKVNLLIPQFFEHWLCIWHSVTWEAIGIQRSITAPLAWKILLRLAADRCVRELWEYGG